MALFLVCISIVLISKKLKLIKKVIFLKYVQLLWKGVIIQDSLIQFRLSKLWNLINTKSVWQNSKTIDTFFQNDENFSKYQMLSIWWNIVKNDNLIKICQIIKVNKIYNFIKSMFNFLSHKILTKSYFGSVCNRSESSFNHSDFIHTIQVVRTMKFN